MRWESCPLDASRAVDARARALGEQAGQHARPASRRWRASSRRRSNLSASQSKLPTGSRPRCCAAPRSHGIARRASRSRPHRSPSCWSSSTRARSAASRPRKSRCCIEGTERMPRAVVEERGMRVVGSEDELLPLCQRLVAEHPKEAAAVRGGKKGVLGFFVGRVMKETQRLGEPQAGQRAVRAAARQAWRRLMRLPHPEPLSGSDYSAVELMPDDASVVLLEQRKLPVEELYVELRRRRRRGARLSATWWCAARPPSASLRPTAWCSRRARAATSLRLSAMRSEGGAADSGEPGLGGRAHARGGDRRRGCGGASSASPPKRVASIARTSRRIAAWAASVPSAYPTARPSSRTATPARWRRAATARRSA